MIAQSQKGDDINVFAFHVAKYTINIIMPKGNFVDKLFFDVEIHLFRGQKVFDVGTFLFFFCVESRLH